jgi:putative transcriptional regulator
MTNHPNRSGRGKSRNPKPAEIKAARIKAGLSQTAAGELIHVNQQTWNQYETDDGAVTNGGHSMHRRMHPAFWELFLRKVAEIE